jgi:hypothetical protein
MPASAAPQHSTNQCAIAVPGITTCTYIAGGQGWFTYAPGANVKLTILVNGQPATIIDQVWQPGGYMQGTFAATAGESVTLKLAAPVCEFCYVHVPSSGAAHAGDGTPAMIGPDAPQD